MKYVIKRILLMILVLFIITTICFMLIRMLPRQPVMEKEKQAAIDARFEALGYNKPLLTQYGIYLENIFTKWDFGTAWYVASPLTPAWKVLTDRFLPTVLVNLYSLLFSIPIGIALGIYAAIRKNKWQDSLISTSVMIFVSVPSYVYAFLVQYIFYSELGWLPLTMLSLYDAGGSYFTGAMFVSMIAPVLALSFGEIAGLCRFTRAELTETLTSDYMLLARTKGLTRAQATARHALKNAMVPILPMIISSFIAIMSGSMVIEKIFSIPGVGQLYINSINQLDYDVFMICTIFYTLVSLVGTLINDLSYGFIDPRIRMGER